VLLKRTCLSTTPASVCFTLVGFLGKNIDPASGNGINVSVEYSFSFVHGGAEEAY
jgi:hypothetical protein